MKYTIIWLQDFNNGYNEENIINRRIPYWIDR